MSLNIRENVELAPYTTFHVGGLAKFFAEVKNLNDVLEALGFANKKALPILVISGGSNILISDEGFSGLVILNKVKGIDSETNGDKVVLTAGAGEEWDRLVKFAAQNNWQGIECLAGIPGSVGAAPVQNIGAYGAEVAQILKEVIAFDLTKNNIVTLNKEECGFGYRKSIFNSEQAGRYIILEVVLELAINGEPALAYQDLQKYFEGKDKPSIKEVYKAVIEIRARKGMVIHPEYESFQSAGSFFKNPIVPKEVFEKMSEKINDKESKWFWLIQSEDKSNQKVKVSAAKLIESAGFSKGYKLGKAGISPKHSLSLINLGGAKAEDIINLAREIINKVKREFDITLEPEVLLIGFKTNPFK